MADNVCSPAGAAGNAGRAIPPEESALPARTAHHFVMEIVVLRPGQLIYLADDSASLLFGMLLNMVSLSSASQPVHPATMNMPAPILAQHDQIFKRPEPFFLPRFLRRTSDSSISISSTSTASSSAAVSCA